MEHQHKASIILKNNPNGLSYFLEKREKFENKRRVKMEMRYNKNKILVAEKNQLKIIEQKVM